MVRIFAGIATSIVGLFALVFGWIISVITAPTVRVPSCSGVWAATVCDPYTRNLTGVHVLGLVASILGGTLIIAIGIVIASWSNIRS